MEKIFLSFLLSCFFLCSHVNAADIDGNIEDSSIDEYHELGKIEKNTSFIVLNSIRRASLKVQNKGTLEDDKNKKNAAANGVILGSGSTVRGDIIIIDKSNSDKIAIAK